MDFIREIDGGFSIIENVKTSGVREGKYGVSVILAPNSTASGVFTTNKVVAAPVTYTKNVVKNGIVLLLLIVVMQIVSRAKKDLKIVKNWLILFQKI